MKPEVRIRKLAQAQTRIAVLLDQIAQITDGLGWMPADAYDRIAAPLQVASARAQRAAIAVNTELIKLGATEDS